MSERTYLNFLPFNNIIPSQPDLFVELLHFLGVSDALESLVLYVITNSFRIFNADFIRLADTRLVSRRT